MLERYCCHRRIDNHGNGVIVESGVEDDVEVEVGSLQPNQPGEWQVLVDVDVDSEVVDVILEEVVVSRQPHHPGVRHVSVRVYEVEVEVDVGMVVVEEIELVELTFPSNVQLKQSLQSASSGSQTGTFSSTAITLLMTPSIPW